MRRKGELENVGEDKNTTINKTFCEQYSKFQQKYTLGIHTYFDESPMICK
jgi:hypothetical protein